MITIASPALVSRWWVLVSNHKPSGMPNTVASISHPMLRTWILRQSWATTTKAIVIEMSTAKGAATSRGNVRASRGTAINASPNPKADRIKVAKKTTTSTCAAVASSRERML
jgi:hypothetical protein